MATYEASHTTDEDAPASAIKRIGTKIAAIGIVVGVNALIIGGGGMIEAGADGLWTPGYSQTRSWFVLVFGLAAWLATVLIVIVVVRRAKRHQPRQASSLPVSSPAPTSGHHGLAGVVARSGER